MARKKRGELGHAIRNMRLRKQAEIQNSEESAPAPVRDMPETMMSGPEMSSPGAEQARAGGRPHAPRRDTHGHRPGK